MSDLDALLEGIVADPSNALRWLVMADYLEENGEPERAELVRVHRELLRTCTATRETKARKQLHARMMELMRAAVPPCLPQRTITLPGGVEMRFSFIPPGSFLMGSPKSELLRDRDEHRHRVTLTCGFWIGQTPVTQRQWKAVMGSEPSHVKGDELPVEMVSWDDAEAYCGTVKTQLRVSLRLPTEAEWECAARSGTTMPFYWGGVLNGMQANCDGTSPYGTSEQGRHLNISTAVGQFAGVSPHPWGLVDVIGNVWEWCLDWFKSYPPGEVRDPIGPVSGSEKVMRGGCWTYGPAYCRAAYRCTNPSGYSDTHIGFRLAADLDALA